MLDNDLHAALVLEAARAPSVHNVQPGRWRLTDDGVELLRERGRELPVGDPTGRDLAASLGAAWEGMTIALSRHGHSLDAPVHVTGEGDDRHAVVARGHIRVHDGTAPDPLAPVVFMRRSHRGRFDAPTADTRARLRSVASGDSLVIDERDAIAEVAALHDRATWHFESDAAYHRELWSWLRLSPRDANWSRDGLNADCLALSAAERAGAGVLLRPALFALLARLGIARRLVSEGSQVRSATGVVLFVPSRDLSPFDVGRRFYRLWLELAGAGLFAAPMSATSDYAETRDAITRRFGIPPDRRLANVLRVGTVTSAAESPRLPVGELEIG